jgi:hypothetical protein
MHFDAVAPAALIMPRFVNLMESDAVLPPARALTTRAEKMCSLAIIVALGSLAGEYLIEAFRRLPANGTEERAESPSPAEYEVFIQFVQLIVDDHYLEFLNSVACRSFGYVSLRCLALCHRRGGISASDFAAESSRVLDIVDAFNGALAAHAAGGTRLPS